MLFLIMHDCAIYSSELKSKYGGVRLQSISDIINPRRMREGYGTWFVIRSFIHSFCPMSCRDHRSLLKLGKGMNRLSTTMACNVTHGFC